MSKSKRFFIRNSKNTPELTATKTRLSKRTREVCVELTDEQLKLMKSAADLKPSMTASQILKAFIMFKVKLPYKHIKDGRL